MRSNMSQIVTQQNSGIPNIFFKAPSNLDFQYNPKLEKNLIFSDDRVFESPSGEEIVDLTDRLRPKVKMLVTCSAMFGPYILLGFNEKTAISVFRVPFQSSTTFDMVVRACQILAPYPLEHLLYEVTDIKIYDGDNEKHRWCFLYVQLETYAIQKYKWKIAGFCPHKSDLRLQIDCLKDSSIKCFDIVTRKQEDDCQNVVILHNCGVMTLYSV